MTGQGTETGRNALAGLPAVQSRRLHRNRLYRRGERTFSSLGRRKSSTLQDSSTWNYTYNQRSEITSAIRKNASNVTQNTMRYGFDSIGNRTSSYENPTSKTYSANSLNQYTGIDVVGGSSISPQYDDDGNTTEYGSWTYTWDAENRLVKAVNGTTRLEFIYDALSRRVAKKLYQGNTLSKHERYVYDGMKLLASYNAKSSFAKINTFLWQPFGADVPLIMTCGSTIYGYLVDANKNVLGLFNPSQSRVATYLYGPSGQIISSSGTIAANNPIRFSSEQFDADLGLVYYNYRYYSPELGRWLSKDPIGEEGGLNLYLMCGNSVVNVWDKWGFILYAIDGTLHSKEKEEEDKSIVQRFCELSIETAKYWGGPIFPITGLDASFIFREVKDEICSDYCADNSLKINIIGWSRGATIAMEIAEYLEDNGCCCNGKKVYPRINWLGLLDAVDMTVTWGWAHDITSNVDNATHLKKTESQLIFPTSSGNAENPQKTKLTEAYLFESTHGDVGGPTKKRNKKRNQAGLHWMVHQAQKSGVKMKDVPVNYIVIKEN